MQVALAIGLLVCGLSGGWAQHPGITAAMRPFVEEQLVAGMVTLVGRREKILDLQALGWMDIAARKRMRTDCVFWVASQTKPITAAALMMLVDEGKMNLDDPVEKYLPEFKEQNSQKPITIRHVLSHTSGLPFKSPLEGPTLDLYPLAERVRSYSKLRLLFEPGAGYHYSNAGINIGGRIIEVVGAMKYEEFLAERLFGPLGMRDATFWPGSSQLKRLAKAYKSVGGLQECPINQLKYPLNDPERQPIPAGGLFMTATDLFQFYRLIACNGESAGRRILSEWAVGQMTTKQTGGLPAAYGLGFNLGGGVIGHGGAYGTHSAYDPHHGLITVFLIQHANLSKEGKMAHPTFVKTAVAIFGRQR